MTRNILMLLVGVSFLASCTKSAKLDTDAQKASYAIGQQIGQNLKRQNIQFDPDVLAASLSDVATDKPSKLSQEDMQKALSKLQEGLVKKQQEEGDKNKKTGADFLAKNKTAEGVKVTPSGLQYIVEKEGTGKTPNLKSTVTAHYVGTLISGEKFDSSYDRGQPAEFPVNGVIKGWTEALQMMKVGGKMKLFIPSELAYGDSPRPGIPANSVLIFEVELLGVKDGDAKETKAATAPKKINKK